MPELRDTDTFGYLQYPLLPVAGAKSVYSDDEVTEATSSRSSLPPERSRSAVEDPSIPPTSGASSALWVAAGIIVLIGGAWLLAVSGSNSSAAVEASPEQAPQVAPADPKLAKAAPAPDPKPVLVRVFSDVHAFVRSGGTRWQVEYRFQPRG